MHQLVIVCPHDSNGALATGDGTLWQRHAAHTQPYIIRLLGKLSWPTRPLFSCQRLANVVKRNALPPVNM